MFCLTVCQQARRLEGDVMESSLMGGLRVLFRCCACTAKGTSLNHSQEKRERRTIEILFKRKKEKSSHIPNKDSHLSSQKERTQSPTVNRRCSLLASPNSRLLSCLLWGYFAHFFFVLKNCLSGGFFASVLYRYK